MQNLKKILSASISLTFFRPVFSKAELRSAKALQTKLTVTEFTAHLQDGFHFNEKAPNGIRVDKNLTKPSKIEKHDISIPWTNKKIKNAVAAIYVCDDKVTFCETHLIPLDGKITNTQVHDNIKIKSSHRPSQKPNKHGFIENNLNYALEKASSQKKVLMIDFGARWCPSCLKLEAEVFSSKSFQDSTKSFVKAKVDVDLFENFIFLEKYKIRGYPTILYLTFDGQEIVRFYDYQPLDFIVALNQEINLAPIAITDLEKKEASPDQELKLGQRLFFAGQYQKSVEILESLPERPKEYLFAKIELANENAKLDPTKKEAYKKTLRSAISEESGSTRSLVWRSTLLDQLDPSIESEKSEIKKIATEADVLTRDLIKDQSALAKASLSDFLGEYTGLEQFYVAFVNAECAETAELEPVKAWELAVEQAKVLKMDARKEGSSLRHLTALMGAKKFDAALILVNEMLAHKNDDGDLLRRKFRILIEKNLFAEAVPIGEKALKKSYGINEFFVDEPLVKAYVGVGKKDAAQKLLLAYLRKDEIHFDKAKSFKSKFEKLSEGLAK